MELNVQRDELLKKKQTINDQEHRAKVFSDSDVTDGCLRCRIARLAEQQIGAKREFLQEVVQEVRVSGNDVTLTYKLPLRESEGKFFTPLRLVGPPGLEPGTNRL